MAETFIGEIRMFGGSFAPVNWALCNGQILAIADYDDLYSLIGTTYGGDGRTTFALPEMRGRIPIHYGAGQGLSPRPMGQKSGMETAYISAEQLPSHTHEFMANSPDTPSADSQTLQGKVLAKTAAGDNFYSPGSVQDDVDLLGGSIGQTGNNEYHYNMMPYMAVNFIIALKGTYPSRP